MVCMPSLYSIAINPNAVGIVLVISDLMHICPRRRRKITTFNQLLMYFQRYTSDGSERFYLHCKQKFAYNYSSCEGNKLAFSHNLDGGSRRSQRRTCLTEIYDTKRRVTEGSSRSGLRGVEGQKDR